MKFHSCAVNDCPQSNFGWICSHVFIDMLIDRNPFNIKKKLFFVHNWIRVPKMCVPKKKQICLSNSTYTLHILFWNIHTCIWNAGDPHITWKEPKIKNINEFYVCESKHVECGCMYISTRLVLIIIRLCASVVCVLDLMYCFDFSPAQW